MRIETYEQALAYWFGHINYEQRTPQLDDLKLDRMKSLLRNLGDPQAGLRIVHVAGSKGKGSTSAMLASILQHAGYRTGMFTSPHLSKYEERFQVNGEPITPGELTEAMADVQTAEAKLPSDAPCTFFEVATAAGFLHFTRRRVDLAVVEVGLGGRFDSTNVCTPLVSLITSISFDHTQQLGNRLASIAMEKAGIIKPGRPVVSGVTAPEPRQVIEDISRERRAPLFQAGVHFRYSHEAGRVTADRDYRSRVRIVTDKRTWPMMELALQGEHQAANAAVAIAAVERLQEAGLSVTDAAVAAGLAGVRWPARLELLCRRPFVVLDCAHNVASAQALIDTLTLSFPESRRLLVFAASGDKDIPGMFSLLARHFAHIYLTRYGSSPRSVPPERLATLLERLDVRRYSVHATSLAAWEAASAAAGLDDLICVAGSVFLAGELRPIICGLTI